jgi:hypothetical protein
MRLRALSCIALFSLALKPAVGAPMTNLERQRLLAHLQMTQSWLADEVAGLTPEQVNFHPASGAWSILEVIEHLVIAEPIYWQDFQRAMKSPPDGRKSNAGDDDILWYGIDRTRRERAIPSEDVQGRLKDVATGLAAFRKLREKIQEYVRTSQEDLRAHIVPRQGCDAYQWLLLITAHSQRHILQIREIKANPRFPKPGR